MSKVMNINYPIVFVRGGMTFVSHLFCEIKSFYDFCGKLAERVSYRLVIG